VFQGAILALVEDPAEIQTASLQSTNVETSRCLKPELHEQSLLRTGAVVTFVQKLPGYFKQNSERNILLAI
jgi:hypothetical protein